MVWYSHLFQNFPQFIVIYTVKGFGIVNKAEGGEGLTNSYEKKTSEGKGKKERYTHLNTEFQRTARRDEKAFFSDQCKEIEENNGKD